MNIIVFTHHDLDGLCSCLAIKWAFPNEKFSYITSTALTFRDTFLKWQLHNKLEDYDKIFIVDLDISNSIDLIDKDNIVIIDHHKTHTENANYQIAEHYVENFSSACMLIYKKFVELYKTKYTKQQKMLIILGDDYDSYNHITEQCKILNSLFWITHNNFETFMELYKDGFVDFTKQQLNLYEQYKQELDATINTLQYFENRKVKIGDKFYHVISTIANKYINNISDYILETYDPDIVIIVKPITNNISFRRHKDSDVDLGKFAELIALGGGHEYSSGGKITEEFLDFTKLLKHKKKLQKINYEQ